MKHVRLVKFLVKFLFIIYLLQNVLLSNFASKNCSKLNKNKSV